MTKAEFIDQHFPPELIRVLKKAGLFPKGKLTHDEIEARVCRRFGYKSIFEYGKALEECEGYHLSLTKRGMDELRRKSE